jgi:hypothetical protein
MLRKQAMPYGWKLFYLFLGISVVYLLVLYLTNTLILTDEVYVKLWSDQLSSGRLEKMLEVNKRMEWVIYVLTPVLLFLKFLLITLAIQAGLFIYNIELPFKKVFNVVLFAEIVPLFATVMQFVYFLWKGVDSFDQINSFSPLSLFSFLRLKDIPSYLEYPLQVVNLFELGYWLLLAIGLKIFLKDSFGKAFKLVASSYGVGLLLWVVLIVFIQIQTS